jgi:hypothetical protein
MDSDRFGAAPQLFVNYGPISIKKFIEILEYMMLTFVNVLTVLAMTDYLRMPSLTTKDLLNNDLKRQFTRK